MHLYECQVNIVRMNTYIGMIFDGDDENDEGNNGSTVCDDDRDDNDSDEI